MCSAHRHFPSRRTHVDASAAALNGGPQFKFTEAISLQVFCDTQDEVDRFWNKLTAGGQGGGKAIAVRR